MHSGPEASSLRLCPTGCTPCAVSCQAAVSGTRWDSSLDAGERRAKPAVPSAGRALKTRGRPPLAPHLACEGFVQSRRAAEKPPRAEPGQSASCLVLGVPSRCLAVERARPTGCLRAASTAPCGFCIFRAPAKRPCLGAVDWRPSEAQTSAARGPRGTRVTASALPADPPPPRLGRCVGSAQRGAGRRPALLSGRGG